MSPIKDLRTHTEPHVSVAELAEYWHVSTRSVYYWITSKKTLKATRVGGSYRVKTADAIAFGRPYEPTFGPVAASRD